MCEFTTASEFLSAILTCSCYISLSFACSILAYSRKTLHDPSKIFVEHARHVAGMLLPYSRALGIAGSV